MRDQRRKHPLKTSQWTAIGCALSAAVLYALNAPLAKLLLTEIPATMMAALLYLGAGIGLFAVGLFQKARHKVKEPPLTRAELPYTLAMILLDIAAPILLMVGLSRTTAANASLLNNFEIVATSVIALMLFKEHITKRLWLAIALVTLSSMILSLEDMSSLSFSWGSLFVLGACVCWGFENNCTRKLSHKNPLEIVVIKGICSGLGSLVIALWLGECITNLPYMLYALLLGFVAYGMSIYFYIHAQRTLGAAKTATYYAIAPFMGVLLSLALFQQMPQATFFVALAVMAGGTALAMSDNARANKE